MNERDIPEVKELLDEWVKEVKKIEPLKIPKNTLGCSLGKKRYELERKYRKLINEAIEKHSKQ